MNLWPRKSAERLTLVQRDDSVVSMEASGATGLFLRTLSRVSSRTRHTDARVVKVAESRNARPS